MIKLKQLLKEDETDDEVKAILKKDYPSFVKALGDGIKDSKFVDAIKSLSDKLPVKAAAIKPAVKNLRPTQNEVVMEKSLSFPLTNQFSAKQYLSGGIAAPKGQSIVTAGGGKYVIDGHHRWSQVYCLNPDTKIKAIDLPIKDPINALKSTQMGIAVQLGKVPTAKGGQTNLFTVSEDVLKKYVTDTITDEVVSIFKKYGKGNTKEKIANYIWENVELLKQNSKPVPNAPKRNIMPQTDDAPNFIKAAPHTDKVGESKNTKLLTLLSVK